MGYLGKKMSVRAAYAHANGEAPRSEWTKGAILGALNEWREMEELPALPFEKLTAGELFNTFFRWTAWHHTGAFYAKTDFYGIDSDAVESATAETLAAIIARRAPKKVRQAEDIAAERMAKAARADAREAKAFTAELFRHQKRYKSAAAFEKNAAFIADLTAEVAPKIDVRREELRAQINANPWLDDAARQRRLKALESDAYVLRYVMT